VGGFESLAREKVRFLLPGNPDLLEVYMDREAFKEWFTDFAKLMGVRAVHFNKSIFRAPLGKGTTVGRYSVSRQWISMQEEWSCGHYLPTERLIYTSLHELGHHIQWLQGKVTPEDMKRGLSEEASRELEIEANCFATAMAQVLLGKTLDPVAQYRPTVYLPRRK
jgi:hypothetical protein